ncbi:MAG TPA: MerR family transcriptional regulator [Candidatus Cybelea sp.]|jgi:DNA-binding transcriptional MerR regulator|nr:MerR family transcriptional regulator [Candidatus Cybelea sp.]
MERNNGELRRIKAFAADAGVSVRTLHLYDRLGLLAPAATTEAGYRLYGDAEFERLEHILALRFVGFTLDQIKELLAGSAPPLGVALRLQRNTLARQKRRLDSALQALDEAQRALAADARADRRQILRTVMEVFKMQNDWKWTQEYYSQEALEQIEEQRRSMPEGAIEQGQRAWTTLVADVEVAVAEGTDPSSERAQALAKRWRDLIAQFTQGNAEIADGLNRMWTETTHWPSDFKKPYSDEAEAFIKAAINCT